MFSTGAKVNNFYCAIDLYHGRVSSTITVHTPASHFLRDTKPLPIPLSAEVTPPARWARTNNHPEASQRRRPQATRPARFPRGRIQQCGSLRHLGGLRSDGPRRGRRALLDRVPRLGGDFFRRLPPETERGCNLQRFGANPPCRPRRRWKSRWLRCYMT